MGNLGFAATVAAAIGGLLAVATPAEAAPVYVTLRDDSGFVEEGVPVVAFSYDVRRVFPEIEQRYRQWRPQPPSPAIGIKAIPQVKSFNTFHLVQSAQLEKFRDGFARAHADEPALLKNLMPRFEAVFKKYGEKAFDGIATNILAGEDERQAWCSKVTRDLNLIIDAHNAGLGVGEGARENYRALYARWLGRRNEALRQAAIRAGGNSSLGFIESTTNPDGLAVFDLPEGLWYMACQRDTLSWYRPVRVTPGGGRVLLGFAEAQRRVIALPEWIGN